jgi:hypothetical protein
MMGAMNEQPETSVADCRRLVQQLVDGSIPAGKDFDESRAVLRSEPAEDQAFQALFELLQGALADPFLGIDETRRVVPVIKALTRGEIKATEMM